MNTLLDTIQYFLIIMAELVGLFLAISTIIAFVLMHLSQDKLKKWMSGRGIWGNIMAVLFGAVTPFCACSTVPITVGLIQAGAPFSAMMSFVIASPLMDPLVFIMLGTFLGWDVAIVFLVLTSAVSIIAGVVLDKMGWAKYVKNVRIKGGEPGQSEEIPKKFLTKVKVSFLKAWADFKRVFWYMIIGVAIGALIYGYLPEELLAQVAGPNNPFAVLVVSLIGLPLYIRVESAIPIGLALIGKGASMGSIIALIISGAGVAIPELTMFASMFKKKIIISFIIIVFVMAVVSGLIVNLLSL